MVFMYFIPKSFQVLEGYGQTETTAAATLQLMGDPNIGIINGTEGRVFVD